LSDYYISEDADIERISVSLNLGLAPKGLRAELSNSIAAIGLRYEAIKSRAVIRVLLGPVNL
jgi:hypothetical protein